MIAIMFCGIGEMSVLAAMISEFAVILLFLAVVAIVSMMAVIVFHNCGHYID